MHAGTSPDDPAPTPEQPESSTALGRERGDARASERPIPTIDDTDLIEIPDHPGHYLLRSEYDTWMRSTDDTEPHHQLALDEYDTLTRAAIAQPPPCAGDTRFISDDLEPAERLTVAHICATRCLIREHCNAYADRAHPTGGIWDGVFYKPRRTP